MSRYDKFMVGWYNKRLLKIIKNINQLNDFASQILEKMAAIDKKYVDISVKCKGCKNVYDINKVECGTYKTGNQWWECPWCARRNGLKIKK